jgi:hypothetical protein
VVVAVVLSMAAPTATQPVIVKVNHPPSLADCIGGQISELLLAVGASTHFRMRTLDLELHACMAGHPLAEVECSLACDAFARPLSATLCYLHRGRGTFGALT